MKGLKLTLSHNLPPRIDKESKFDDGSLDKNSQPMRDVSSGPGTFPSTVESGKGSGDLRPHTTMVGMSSRLADEEQALFEERLYADAVSVRKINQHGKSNLRPVRCVPVEETDLSTRSCSSRSGSSWTGRQGPRLRQMVGEILPDKSDRQRWALSWGKKKDTLIKLDQFTAVRMGKTTPRTKKHAAGAERLLSIIAGDVILDMEAPTRTDRDKFAKAFSVFLGVPLQEEAAARIESPEPSKKPPVHEGGFYPPPLPPSVPLVRVSSDKGPVGSMATESMPSSTHRDPTSSSTHQASQGPVCSVVEHTDEVHEMDSEGSDVSSITGHGYDQEIVEELHHALTEMRAELEESRAEAARAVKVAEQAIQSAERSNSLDWQNTVTHKAAAAAAAAQKRSAEAMAKQRLAEERLEAERKTAAFWRKQATMAEEEAGLLQTRAAAAEVQRAAMESQLESERALALEQLALLRSRMDKDDGSNKEETEALKERSLLLELELDKTRQQLEAKAKEEAESDVSSKSSKKRLSFKSRKKPQVFAKKLGPPDRSNSTSALEVVAAESASVPTDQLMKLQAEATYVREQFEILRRITADELHQLPQNSKKWVEQVRGVLEAAQAETARLRERLAFEAASRRKLLHEVQDLRGTVRVYCRPRAVLSREPKAKSLVSLASQETLMIHRERTGKKGDRKANPLSFTFDRVFQPDSSQHEVFAEIEDVCLSALDGFNVCVISFGARGSGKTHTLLGDVVETDDKVSIINHGVQLRAIEELFKISAQRTDRYRDVFSLTIVEVSNDRLSDLLAGTETGVSRGEIVIADSTKSPTRKKSQGDDDASSGIQKKLEIRTDVHGETIVQGLLSLVVESYEEVCTIWNECLEARSKRLVEQDVDLAQYDASCHVMATLRVQSSNIATGIGCIGKIQFVDLASVELAPATPSSPSSPKQGSAIIKTEDYRFADRSLETLDDVVSARTQFDRTVPYRNSTITHLLRDSLEHDTKVVLIACVSSESKDAEETTAVLRFASRMSKVSIGKATKHMLTPP